MTAKKRVITFDIEHNELKIVCYHQVEEELLGVRTKVIVSFGQKKEYPRFVEIVITFFYIVDFDNLASKDMFDEMGKFKH